MKFKYKQEFNMQNNLLLYIFCFEPKIILYSFYTILKGFLCVINIGKRKKKISDTSIDRYYTNIDLINISISYMYIHYTSYALHIFPIFIYIHIKSNIYRYAIRYYSFFYSTCIHITYVYNMV